MESSHLARTAAGLALAALLGPLRAPLAAVQELEAKLTASDADVGDKLGEACAIAGDTAVVGAALDEDFGVASGSAYVFERSAGVWAQTAKLTAAARGAPLAQFGHAVDMDEERIVVGALGEDDGAGAVYVFHRAGSAWPLEQVLQAPDRAPGDWFGVSVALDGARLAVGAEQDGDLGPASGSVYVFERNGAPGAPWTRAAKLHAPSGTAGDRFGVSVALDGERLACGAHAEGGHGAAYVFERTAGVFGAPARLLPSRLAPDGEFGRDVALEGERLVVGAPRCGTCSGAGAAFVFERVAGAWTERAALAAEDGHASDRFGHALALEGERLVVGARWSDRARTGGGAVYVYRGCGGDWSLDAALAPFDLAPFDEFGSSVALAGERILAGSARDDDDGSFSGSAYVYSMRLCDTFPFCFGVPGLCPCGNPDAAAGCANSTGAGALLAVASGTTSVAADDLVLDVGGLPAGEVAIVYLGGGRDFRPFGDGVRCVRAAATGFQRFAPRLADGAGRVQLGPGIVAESRGFPRAGRIEACRTYPFQCWYRDPLGPCGSGFNLSNGLEVFFVP